jgi:hypothetical protein
VIDIPDFRPIRLISGAYKIINKVLTNRMSPVMEKIISKPQNAFVKGGQILNSVLIASECLDIRLNSSNPGLLCKLDIVKAFDHVNWNFLLYMMGVAHGEMVLLDSALHIFGLLLRFGKWLSSWFFQ